jgi:antitoxin component of MazEF toxin-antitoxin module
MKRRRKRKHTGSRNDKVRKISKAGFYSYYVTIPKAVIDELGWHERQKVTVEKVGKSVLIKDWIKC